VKVAGGTIWVDYEPVDLRGIEVEDACIWKCADI